MEPVGARYSRCYQLLVPSNLTFVSFASSKERALLKDASGRSTNLLTHRS